MFETFLAGYVKLLAGFLVVAGFWSALMIGADIKRCGRLILSHLISLICAGSAFALGLSCLL